MVRGYTYILCNCRNGTLYIGVTKNLWARMEEHKSHVDPEIFTAKHNATRLVNFEVFDLVSDALTARSNLKLETILESRID